MSTAVELLEGALAAARGETIVIVTETSSATLRFAVNSMTTNGVDEALSCTVIAIVRDDAGAHVGSVTAAGVQIDDVSGLVRAAENAASAAPAAPDAQDLLPGEGGDPDDWDCAAAVTGVDAFESLVPELSRAFRADGRTELFGFAQHNVRTTWLGTTTGLRRRACEPLGTVELNAKRGPAASAWAGVGGADLRQVALPAILDELSRRLDWSARSVELPAGRYDVVLPPSCVADLMIPLLWGLDGRGAQEGRSAFSRAGGTRVGERIATLPLSLTSDPHAAGLEYAPFVATAHSGDSVSVFDNGLGTDAVRWIDDGTLAALAYSRADATEFGAPVAVPGENLIVTGGSDASTDDLVADVERGLLLTTLWYIRDVDPSTMLLTGLTRDGVYLIEDGRITGSVNNFRFNESPIDLLRRASAAGATERTLPREWGDWFTRAAVPPLRIPDFHMSSVSQAR